MLNSRENAIEKNRRDTAIFEKLVDEVTGISTYYPLSPSKGNSVDATERGDGDPRRCVVAPLCAQNHRVLVVSTFVGLEGTDERGGPAASS